MPSPSRSITVVVPAYNEEVSLEGVVKRCLDFLPEIEGGEVVIVDDGSTDATGQIADRLAQQPHVQAIHHPSNMGIGASVRDGLRLASQEFLTFIPADGQIDPFELRAFLGLMPCSDIIVSTYIGERRGPFREALSWSLRLIMRLLIGFGVKHEGIYLARRSFLLNADLRSQSFFLSFEIILEILRQGGRLGETRIHVLPRTSGQSKVLTLKKISAVFREVLAYRSRIRKG